MNDNDNITFFFEETNIEVEDNNLFSIKQMIEELNEDNESNNFWFCKEECEELNYFINKIAYGNDELYYSQEYTVKDLLKICEYYGIEKNIKTSKCKKQDIISTIVYFESIPENAEIVSKRNKMWAYITELLNDSKMKKYIIF